VSPLPPAAGVMWTETFTGWLAFGQTDFNQAILPQHREATTATLSVAIPHLEHFLAGQADGGVSDRPARPAAVTSGSIECDGFAGTLTVTGGTLEAFVPAGDREPRDALHQRIRYHLQLRGAGGEGYRLEGFKLIENDPGYDSWSDTTTLFVRIFQPVGWAPSGNGSAPADPPVPVAIGVLQISPLAFIRELTTFRGSGSSRVERLKAVVRYQRFFASSLARVYLGAPVGGSRPAFPRDWVQPPWRSTPSPGPRRPDRWDRVPGTRLGRSVIPFDVPDRDLPLNLHRLRKLDGDGHPVLPMRGPVLLVPGSGVRAEMYYGQPIGPSFAEFLLGEGYDVWVETWRASIDLPPTEYTLDQAAMIDHPRAVETILDICDGEGGGHDLKAVVHCQGSISFVMAAVAGRIDERVTHIVSSAVSLFLDVTLSTWLKQRLAMPLVMRMFDGLDAQWGIRPVTPSAGMFAAAAKRFERPCRNPTCQVANYMYGSGWDVLFRHVDNYGDPWVADAVHEWTGRELGYTPLSLIQQVAESSRRGYIVPSASPPPGTPAAYLNEAPRTKAQITFIAGDHNNMFRWQGQRRAKQFFDQAVGAGQADFVLLPGFGHLDTFWARAAPKIVFPVIRDGLDWQAGAKPPSDGRLTAGARLPPRRGRIFRR
jgi:hypothetical protein